MAMKTAQNVSSFDNRQACRNSRTIIEKLVLKAFCGSPRNIPILFTAPILWFESIQVDVYLRHSNLAIPNIFHSQICEQQSNMKPNKNAFRPQSESMLTIWVLKLTYPRLAGSIFLFDFGLCIKFKKKGCERFLLAISEYSRPVFAFDLCFRQRRIASFADVLILQWRRWWLFQTLRWLWIELL